MAGPGQNDKPEEDLKKKKTPNRLINQPTSQPASKPKQQQQQNQESTGTGAGAQTRNDYRPEGRAGQGRGPAAWKQGQPFEQGTSKHREKDAMLIWNSPCEASGASSAGGGGGSSDLCKKYGGQVAWLWVDRQRARVCVPRLWLAPHAASVVLSTLVKDSLAGLLITLQDNAPYGPPLPLAPEASSVDRELIADTFGDDGDLFEPRARIPEGPSARMTG